MTYYPHCYLGGQEVDVWDCRQQHFVWRGIGSAMAHRLWQDGLVLFPANLFTAEDLKRQENGDDQL